MMDPQLRLFRRQYLQLFEPDFLAWPPKQLLKDPYVQAWLYNNLFNADNNPYLPSERYQLRVIKPLVAKIENSIDDPEEDVGNNTLNESASCKYFLSIQSEPSLIMPISLQEISDDLVSHLSLLIASDLPSEGTAVQQKSYVTFSCLAPSRDSSDLPFPEPTVTLLERRHLIFGSLTTGFRTWEAALHLGSYLLANPDVVRQKSVFELGAGTGLISILAAKHLEAKHITATDGDEKVIESLKENLFLNEVDSGGAVNASVLRWGHALRGTWVEEECEDWPYDVVLGSDITYEKAAHSALVSTMRFFFDLRPSIRIIISGAVRNAETFESFRNICERNHFHVQELDFNSRPIREQTALFYAVAVPLKILSITKNS